MKSTYVCDVYLQIDGVYEKSWESREGACVREREGVHVNAMRVSVNHIWRTFTTSRFLANAQRTVRSASDGGSFAMAFDRTATPLTHKIST